MEQELQRACKIVDSILAKEPESQDWGELFQPSDFFVRYDKYLGIKVSALSKEDHAQLSGYVESQVRRLLYFMEGMPLKGACPWHKGLTEQKAFSIDAEEDEDFDALRAQPGVPLRTEHAEGGGAGDAAGVEKKEGEGAVGAEGSTNAPAKEEGTKAPLQSPEVIVKQENGVAADTITASQVKQEGGTAPAAAAGAGGGGVEASENGSQAKLDTKPQAAAASAASGKASAAGGGEEEEKELVAMEYMTTFFMGLEVDRSYVKRGMRLNLEPAVRSFLASVNVKTPEDAEVRQRWPACVLAVFRLTDRSHCFSIRWRRTSSHGVNCRMPCSHKARKRRNNNGKRPAGSAAGPLPANFSHSKLRRRRLLPPRRKRRM